MAQVPLPFNVTIWKRLIDGLLGAPLAGVSILTQVALIDGATVVNHKLGRQMQGWFIVDQNAAASIYRSAPFNPTTLTLTSSAAVTVNLVVF